MAANPAVGVVYHWLGGLASGSFYVPYRGVKRWAWEVYWLAGGFFSWMIAPWILGLLLTKDLLAVLHEAPGSALFWAFFFGLLWGIGNNPMKWILTYQSLFSTPTNLGQPPPHCRLLHQTMTTTGETVTILSNKSNLAMTSLARPESLCGLSPRDRFSSCVQPS